MRNKNNMTTTLTLIKKGQHFCLHETIKKIPSRIPYIYDKHLVEDMCSIYKQYENINISVYGSQIIYIGKRYKK